MNTEVTRRNLKIRTLPVLLLCAILNGAPDVQESQAQLQEDERVSAVVKAPGNPQDIAEEK